MILNDRYPEATSHLLGIMTAKSPLENRLSRELTMFGEPNLLNGAHIQRMIDLKELHLTEVGMALGVNTAALYTKKGKADPCASSISILLRLYAAFPEALPKLPLPDVEEFMAKIMAIDPEFKKSHLGPLLGLETNSSFRLHKGFDKASQTAKILVHVINKLIDEDPSNWWVIRDAVQIEAEASSIDPPRSVWTKGGWSRGRVKLEGVVTKKVPRRSTPKPESKAPAPSKTAKPLKRHSKPDSAKE